MKKKHEDKELAGMDLKESDAMDSGSPSQEGPEEHEESAVEMAAHHLMEAEKIKDQPSLHAAAKKHLHSKKKAIEKITSIDDLKSVRNKMMKS